MEKYKTIASTKKFVQRRRRILTSICVIVLLFNVTRITAAEDIVTSNQINPSTEREITADSLKWEYEKGLAVFTDNVTMKSKEGEITASKMTVFFDDKDEIEKMVAEGNAGLTREKQKGGGEIIEIYPLQDLLILKQGSWISSDKALFKGEEISFDTAKEIINITQGVKGEIQTSNNEESSKENTMELGLSSQD